MESQLIRVFAIQVLAIVGFVLLLPVTEYFGINLIEGSALPSTTSLVGFTVYMFLLAYGGKLLLGERFFVDPIRPGLNGLAGPITGYSRYGSRFPMPFLPGIRGRIQVTPEPIDPGEANELSQRLENAMARKLRQLQHKEEEKRDDQPDPVLV